MGQRDGSEQPPSIGKDLPNRPNTDDLAPLSHMHEEVHKLFNDGYVGGLVNHALKTIQDDAAQFHNIYDQVLKKVDEAVAHFKKHDGPHIVTEHPGDGSTVVKETNADGSSVERWLNADKSKAVEVKDKSGNFTRTNYDRSGTMIGDNVHTEHSVGSSTDTDHNAAGLAVWNRETKDQSYNLQMLNLDKSLTIHDQDAAGNYVETTYAEDGTKLSEKVHHKNDPVVTKLRPVTDQPDVTKVVPSAVYIDSSNIFGGQGFRRNLTGQPEKEEYWLSRPVAEALMRAQARLAAEGKVPVLLADMNAAGRRALDRELIGKFAPGQPHALKHSQHENGLCIDAENYDSPGIKQALTREGFVHNVPGDRPHFTWFGHKPAPPHRHRKH
jgi:hypothetical protein